jgi:hypothetical protein
MALAMGRPGHGVRAGILGGHAAGVGVALTCRAAADACNVYERLVSDGCASRARLFKMVLRKVARRVRSDDVASAPQRCTFPPAKRPGTAAAAEAAAVTTPDSVR